MLKLSGLASESSKRLACGRTGHGRQAVRFLNNNAAVAYMLERTARPGVPRPRQCFHAAVCT